MGAICPTANEEQKEELVHKHIQKRQISEADKATADLLQQQDLLDDQLNYYENEIKLNVQKIKNFIKAKQKERALCAAKSQVIYQAQITKICDRQALNAQLRNQIKDAVNTAEFQKTFQQTNQTIKDLEKQIDRDKLQDEIQDLQEIRANQDMYDQQLNDMGINIQQEQSDILAKFEAEVLKEQMEEGEQNIPDYEPVKQQQDQNIQKPQQDKERQQLQII